jgi:hypothetical protein
LLGVEIQHLAGRYNSAMALNADTANDTDPGLAFEGDGRLSTTRRMRSLISDFTAQVPPSRRNATTDLLVRRLASAVMVAEGFDRDIARGEPVDAKLLLQATSTVSQLLRALGLLEPPPSRKPRLRADAPLEQFLEQADPLESFCEALMAESGARPAVETPAGTTSLIGTVDSDAALDLDRDDHPRPRANVRPRVRLSEKD